MKDILYGELGIIGMEGCEGFTSQVDNYIREWAYKKLGPRT